MRFFFSVTRVVLLIFAVDAAASKRKPNGVC